MKQSVCLVPFWGVHQKLISALGMANFLQRDMAPSSAVESKAIPGEQTRTQLQTTKRKHVVAWNLV